MGTTWQSTLRHTGNFELVIFPKSIDHNSCNRCAFCDRVKILTKLAAGGGELNQPGQISDQKLLVIL